MPSPCRRRGTASAVDEVLKTRMLTMEYGFSEQDREERLK